MTEDKSVFGADLDGLKRLLTVGDDEPESALESCVSPVVPLSGELTEKVGLRLGHYRLLRVLGEGGMGIVYLAEQTDTIRRRVALKLIKPGMDSKRVIARFESERQALALLDHPSIAHVYDAGTAQSGRPYFAMEYVQGSPITEYCDRHRLSIEDRLAIFQQVCYAVHHAHQKGIIHRDIKPSNVLVSAEGDRATPKIIDFGVAKAMSQPLTERTLFTEDNRLLGTPEYMSPEQADMVNEDIDTRSDIYSLGVLLYVLLTGILPYDSKTFRQGGAAHMRQIICETDPKTPSTRLMRLGDEAQAIAQKRRMERHNLTRHLRRELEWIPLKAMRKERSERYRSASELSDDIDNYLRGVPLIAGPPTTVYRLRKAVRRHRALVLGTLAVFATTIIGAAVSLIFAIGQARAYAEAQTIADFLRTGVLGTVANARAGEATVSYVLDAATQNLAGQFDDRPFIEASIRETLGQTYRLLAESAKAEQHWLAALQIYQQHYGAAHPATLRAMGGLYWVYDDQERHYDAMRLRTEMLQIKTDMGTVGNTGALAHTYQHLGKYDEAESLYNLIIKEAKQEQGDNHIQLNPHDMCNLARVYAGQGRYDKAENLFCQTLETAPWEPESRWRLMQTANLADLYRDQGQYEKAEPLLIETLVRKRRVLGDGHVFTLRSMCYLARLYTAQARIEEAEALLSEGLSLCYTRLRPNHPATLRFVNALAVLRTKQGNYAQARALFDEALKGRQQELGPDHPHTLDTRHAFGVLNLKQGAYPEAERMLQTAYQAQIKELGPGHPHTLDAIESLVQLYELWGKPAEAQQCRSKLPKPCP